MLDDPLYDRLDTILHSYYDKYIKMKEEKRKIIVENLKKELEETMEKLKETDSLFDKYYNRLVYTGSYWNRTRVKEATEFDVNLVFKLPDGLVVIRPTTFPPGHAFIKVAEKQRPRRPVTQSGINTEFQMYYTEPFLASYSLYDPCGLLETDRRRPLWTGTRATFSSDYQIYYRKPFLTQPAPQGIDSQIERWISDNVIKPDLFLNWLERVFARAGITMRQSVSKSGPALTGTMAFNEAVTVDYTPVFEVVTDTESWFAVPKPHKQSRNTWRVSFCEMEKQMLQNADHLRFILKLIKKIRDNLGMHKLSSYFIRTLFLRELQKNENINWKKNMGRLFMHMLNRLAIALEIKNLPSIVDERLNLFYALNDSTLNNMYGQIKNFITDLNMILRRSEYRNAAIEEKLNFY